jgi:hypothetical protein
MELEVGLQEAPADLATVAPSFGAAHLFIDGLNDCPDLTIRCIDLNQVSKTVGTIPSEWHDGFCRNNLMAYGRGPLGYCIPCTTPRDVIGRRPDYGDAKNVWAYWSQQCAEIFTSCTNCRAMDWCATDPGSFQTYYCPAYV